MTAALAGALFLSGVAALLFETLWFRLAGLVFGNSVWASSIVLASFMCGLGTGNGWAARRAGRMRRPLMAYALLEAVVGISGLALVVALPALARVVGPLMRATGGAPGLATLVRLVGAFVLLVVPTTAMGATLPVCVGALWRGSAQPSTARFGSLLGLLYGLNTLGATAGALLGEGVLIGTLGLRGTGLAAAAFNLVAAATALATARHADAVQATEVATRGPAPARLLGAAALSGACVLALEVVWFRFLLLFAAGTNAAFATMLAVVLVGIAVGGVAAGAAFRVNPRADLLAPHAALAAGIAGATAYAAFRCPLGAYGQQFIRDPRALVPLAAALMLPVTVFSGGLFTLIGAAVERQVGAGSRSAGLVVLANTIGASAGALLGGFVLLPLLGIERSIFLLAAAFGLVAWCCRPTAAAPGTGSRPALLVLAASFVVVLALFPFGLMWRRYVMMPLARLAAGNAQLVGLREGLTETLAYLCEERFGQPVRHVLVTNGFSMAHSDFVGRRYMRSFVYLPVALRPEPRQALLISYGLGFTARALADTRSLQMIDVADTSRDVLDMGRLVFPGLRWPLTDARVRVHVEDGRQFLLTTPKRFDLITAEPPPPKIAGVVSLYSAEYFALLRERLTEGGVVSYWLPVNELSEEDARAIVSGFCQAFADCSLWNGMQVHWTLLGSRGGLRPATAESVGRQWVDPVVGPELRRIAIETPAALGATFMADADQLRTYVAGAPPLTDDRPHRVSPDVGRTDQRHFATMDPQACRERFRTSSLMARIWPADLREATLAAFHDQDLLLRGLLAAQGYLPRRFHELDQALSTGAPRTLVLLLAASDDAVQQALDAALARGDSGPEVELQLAARALADHDLAAAETHLAQGQSQAGPDFATYLRIFSRRLRGNEAGAAALAAEVAAELRRVPAAQRPADGGFWDWWREAARRRAVITAPRRRSSVGSAGRNQKAARDSRPAR